MVRVIMCALALGALQQPVGTVAKKMFYDPADVGASEAPTSTAARTALRAVTYATPFPAYGHVGIHYWFEDGAGARYSERQAAMSTRPLTLHVRSNVHGFLTIWSLDGVGAELTPRMDSRWAGHDLSTKTFVVPGSFTFRPGDQASRLIIVFARSQTEVPSTPPGAAERLSDLGSRAGSDGWPQIISESDDNTPGEIGVYVVNRVGMPVAAQVNLRSRDR